jgi:hypothetical protein
MQILHTDFIHYLIGLSLFQLKKVVGEIHQTVKVYDGTVLMKKLHPSTGGTYLCPCRCLLFHAPRSQIQLSLPGLHNTEQSRSGRR